MSETIGRCGACMEPERVLNADGDCLECELRDRHYQEGVEAGARLVVAEVLALALDNGESRARLHRLVDNPQEAM